MIVAPEGVSWGTTNTPVEKRIDPAKAYKTKDGRNVVGLNIKLENGSGCEATFPVKGSIDRGPRKSPRYAYNIWTLDGRDDLLKESGLDIVEVKGDRL